MGTESIETSASTSISQRSAGTSILGQLSQSVAQYADFPPEILSIIFLRTTPPEFLLDSSHVAGPNSPWWKAVETTLSFSAVCKSWHLTGISFLYETVVFRNLRQLPIFLRTIETNPSKYQNLIKQITIHAFVYPHYGASFSKYLQNIIDSCPSLKRFSFLTPAELPCTATIPTLTPGVTHLCLHTATPTILSLLDCVRDSLISLSINIHHAPIETIRTDKTFSLPNLQDLSVCVEDDDKSLIRLLKLLLVPRLQRFIFSGSARCNPDIILTSFLETYGQHVTSLHLRFAVFDALGADLQRLLQACPILEHIALYPGIFASVTHSNVRWVDIGSMPPGWAPGWEDEDSMWTQAKAKAAFPKLKGVREVFTTGYNGLISVALPPDMVMTADDAFDITFHQVELQYRPGVVRIKRFIDHPEYFEDTISDYDSDYVYESDSDVSYSSEEFEATQSTSVGSLEDLLEDLEDGDCGNISRFDVAL